jgi:hypothetical protein
MSAPARVQMWAALRAARFAATTEQPVTACPYRPDSDRATRVLAAMFVREYLRLRSESHD